MSLIIVAMIIAYLLGSINCAIIVCKLANKESPLSQGSGNPGASNVLRIAGKTCAALTLLGDGLKGFVAVFIGMLFGADGFLLSVVALCAVIGHMYPVFFKFQGGKGVATALGCYFALSLTLGLVALVIWAALVGILRYASIASLVTCVIAPFIVLMVNPPYFVGLVLIALLVIWRHRENIDRLRKGTENKFTVHKPSS